MADSVLNAIVKDEAWEKFAKPVYYKVKLKEPIKKYYKISICITCMNRTADLKQTLLKNIKDNLDYPKVEFVLLDYNSQDGLSDYIRSGCFDKFIKNGILAYYRTDEPQFYSMTHSRNIAFKVASGDIVNNVDADHFTNAGFAAHINLLANQISRKVVYVKSRQKNRGRLGFFKNDFIEHLGGYNEEIEGYGYDDNDLLHRAAALGFIAIKFGGTFFRNIVDHKRHPTDNFQNNDWRYTQRKNTLISLLNIAAGRYRANRNTSWGKARLTKNFTGYIEV